MISAIRKRIPPAEAPPNRQEDNYFFPFEFSKFFDDYFLKFTVMLLNHSHKDVLDCHCPDV